jgi:hypothetical protein
MLLRGDCSVTLSDDPRKQPAKSSTPDVPLGIHVALLFRHWAHDVALPPGTSSTDSPAATAAHSTKPATARAISGYNARTDIMEVTGKNLGLQRFRAKPRKYF